MTEGETMHSTKDLNRNLTRADLMSVAVGQIIGAGIYVMTISALLMTGRSVNLAFLMAGFFTVVGQLPVIFIASVARLRGGTYTQVAMLLGPQAAGVYSIVFICANLSVAMYALGFVSYISYIVPMVATYQYLLAGIVMTLFFVINFFGTKAMIMVQKGMTVLLIVALVMFVLFGAPTVQWSGYFGNELFDEPFIFNGTIGFLQATSYLTFAIGGASVVLEFSGEAKNPKKDIPFVIIATTLGITVLYFLMAMVICGNAPASMLGFTGSLSTASIFEIVMPKVAYYFYMICGMGFALSTTLNASIAWVTKPILQACEDGWFPRVLGTLHPKYKSPVYLLGLLWAINLVPLVVGWNIRQMGQWVLLITHGFLFVLTLATMRLPKLFPEAWEKSAYHVPNGVLYCVLILSACVTGFQAYMNIGGLGAKLVLVNIAIALIATLYAFIMTKTGKVNVQISYELD